MYGADRLKQPLLRGVNSKGDFDKNGDFAPVFKKSLWWDGKTHQNCFKEKGQKGLEYLHLGQYTIAEGYAALKMMKTGFRSQYNWWLDTVWHQQ